MNLLVFVRNFTSVLNFTAIFSYEFWIFLKEVFNFYLFLSVLDDGVMRSKKK